MPHTPEHEIGVTLPTSVTGIDLPPEVTGVTAPTRRQPSDVEAAA